MRPRANVNPPASPSRLLFALGFVATGLVAFGVGGELYEESKIATLETCVRKGNDALFLLLSREAADERSERIKLEASVTWRRLSKNHQQV